MHISGRRNTITRNFSPSLNDLKALVSCLSCFIIGRVSISAKGLNVFHNIYNLVKGHLIPAQPMADEIINNLSASTGIQIQYLEHSNSAPYSLSYPANVCYSLYNIVINCLTLV